jgi:hypothetical protein
LTSSSFVFFFSVFEKEGQHANAKAQEAIDHLANYFVK